MPWTAYTTRGSVTMSDWSAWMKSAGMRSADTLLHVVSLCTGSSITQSPFPLCATSTCSQVQGAWRTDEIRRRKPSPQDESREGLTYFHETIYSGLPVFLRRIDTALKNIGQPMLPLNAKLFSFGNVGNVWAGAPFDAWLLCPMLDLSPCWDAKYCRRVDGR